MTGSDYDRLQAALGNAYTIERELGRGGMATVYLARDAKHQRRVALKVLDPNLAASLGPERFRREITTAAQLQHPHILGVHDSGETADGQLWFTMPYVEGESLRERLRHERQMSVQDVVRIIREVAGALDYAHQKGVLHRDIKPENILLTTGGDALLADFGIARALDASATNNGSRGGLTQTGLSIGTPQYMSPEQAAGERGLDARSDIFSLGAVCYEMLAGEPPFSAPTQQAIVAKILTTDAPSVRVLRPDVSPAIDAILARAMQRVPAERWRSAGEMAHALEAEAHATHTAAPVAPVAMPALASEQRPPSRRKIPVSALALILGLAIGGGALFAWRSHSQTSAPGESGLTRVAVLPFENVGDTSDAYFADGVTDAVRGKLTGVPGIEVIGSASSAQYRKTTKTPQQIGQELGVRYLLIGRVHWARAAGGTSRVQVSPELIDASTAADKWQQPFDAPLTDVFQVQGDIASKVAQALEVALTPAAKQDLAAKPTKDLVAYDSYLRGLALRNSGNSASILRRAIVAHTDAVVRDSTFALAWSALGGELSLMYSNGVPSPALADSADKATETALRLQPDLEDARASRSRYYSFVTRDNVRSLAEAKEGLAHAQTSALYAAAASAEEQLGKWDAAAADAMQAYTLDPRSPSVVGRLANIAVFRRDSTGRMWADRAMALAPGNFIYMLYGVLADVQHGDLAAARRRMHAPAASTDPSALVAYFGEYYDLGWTLDSAQDKLLLSLGVDSFDGDTAAWQIVRAQQFRLHGDQANTRVAAELALAPFESQLKVNPRDAQRRLFVGLCLAYLGRNAEAIQEGERAVATRPSYRDNAVNGPYFDQVLARVYMTAGKPEQALDILERLLQHPYYLTPAWLRVDPTFAPLRGNPRFEKLIASEKTVT
ncbi:MAG TPA: serine/threonine-protein kinase [Gemmatimonadaceae bacterium]